MMKGELKMLKRLASRAFEENGTGVTTSHVRVIESLTSDDLHVIRETGQLDINRAELIANTTSISVEDVKMAIAKLTGWLRGPTDSVLETYEIKRKKMGDGMVAIEYSEFGGEDAATTDVTDTND